MYTRYNYKTKKALKTDIAERNALCAYKLSTRAELPEWTTDLQHQLNGLTRRLTVYQPNGDITGSEPPTSGRCCCEGPHYPELHRWYATVAYEDMIAVNAK